MQGICQLALFYIICLSSPVKPLSNIVSDNRLIGFWPLNNVTNLEDVSQHCELVDGSNARLLTNFPGPYGFPGTSHSVSESNSYLARYNITRKANSPQSFTISFYIYASGSTGVISLWSPDDTQEFLFSVMVTNEYGKGRQFRIHFRAWTFRDSFVVPIREHWTFVAITYDHNDRLLWYYDHCGRAIRVNTAKMLQPLRVAPFYVDLGTSAPGYNVSMTDKDALACVMLFKKALSPSEIATLPGECIKVSFGRNFSSSTNNWKCIDSYNNINDENHPASILHWPRPNATQAFWPFDSVSGLVDSVEGRLPFSIGTPKLMTSIDGPFGLNDSSHTCEPATTGGGCSVAIYGPFDPPLNRFTISFYFYTLLNGTGNILSARKSATTNTLFDISYCDAGVVKIYTPNPLNIPYLTQGLLKPNSWNFLAITFDITDDVTRIYNSTGHLLVETRSLKFRIPASYCLNVGPYEHMQPTDAIACLMVYNETLTPCEIVGLEEVCRNKGRSPCQSCRHFSPKNNSQIVRYWPQPQNLLGFWPFNNELLDFELTTGIGHASTGEAILRNDIAGPFGKNGTSYSAGCATQNECYIGTYRNFNYTFSSFTVSFYFNTQASGRGTVVSAWHYLGVVYFFSVGYSGTTIELLLSTYNIDRFHLPSVFKPNDWNFVAVVFNEEANLIEVYNERGQVVASCSLTLATKTDVAPGFYSKLKDAKIDVGAYMPSSTMQPKDAIACLMIYRTVLKPAEILQLPGVCERSGGSFWPKPENSVRFWPFNNQTKLIDLVSYQPLPHVGHHLHLENNAGPFNFDSTSISPQCDELNCSIGHDCSLPSKLYSFTIAFYFHVKSSDHVPGNILSLLSTANWLVNYNDTTIEVIANEMVVARYRIVNDEWVFIALAYDNETQELTIFDEFGNARMKRSVPHLSSRFIDLSSAETCIFIGESVASDNASIFFHSVYSLACLMVYNVSLLPTNIAELPESCKASYVVVKSDEAYADRLIEPGPTIPDFLIANLVIAGFLIFVVAVSTLVVVVRSRRKKLARNEECFENALAMYILPAENFSDVLDSLKSDELKDLVRQLNVKEDRLHVGPKLGSGHFGDVFKGELRSSDDEDGQRRFVAIKQLRHLTAETMVEFLREAAVMIKFDHPNILPVTGIAVLHQQPNIIMPFMRNGNLRVFLRQPGSKQRFTQNDLAGFCAQICKGMVYLSDQGYIHRDLACRNILVDHDSTLKIADFGMAKAIGTLEKNYYKLAKSERPLPVAWHPPESLRRLFFNCKSDVWSFGVVIWEIFSFAETPFIGLKNVGIVEHVLSGNRLTRPEFCPELMYQEIMLRCWKEDVTDRLSFKDLDDLFSSIDWT